jgi:LPS sulfotransferase NodH
VAGNPDEWLYAEPCPEKLYDKYSCTEPIELQEAIWKRGLGANGVFGIKIGFSQPNHDRTIKLLRQFPDCSDISFDAAQVINAAFSNCRHIWITRRNKVRLAVSWWKAIKTGEFHRENGTLPNKKDIRGEYLFEAIDHLYCEASMREAGLQEFFSSTGIIPHTVVYEDFIADVSSTLISILDYLKIPIPEDMGLSKNNLEKLADDLSEEWIERYREEKQKGWPNKGW